MGADGAATRRRMPYRSGMMLSAIGIGIAVCGLAFRGALRLDGDASFGVPRVLQDWFVTGGLRVIADTELHDPRLLFAGVGLTFLLVGAVQLLNDFVNRKALS